MNRQILLAFPHERVEYAFVLKTQALVEINCAMVCFSHSQGQRGKVPLAEVCPRAGQQCFSNAMRTVLGKHANLGDVSYIVPDTGTENQADHVMKWLAERDKRRLRIEYPTTGEAHDIVQEAQRAAESAVLVVDF